MVRGDVGVGAASDVVVDEPLAVQRSQQAQDAHMGLGEEDVVDHTLPTKHGVPSTKNQIQRDIKKRKYGD